MLPINDTKNGNASKGPTILIHSLIEFQAACQRCTPPAAQGKADTGTQRLAKEINGHSHEAAAESATALEESQEASYKAIDVVNSSIPWISQLENDGLKSLIRKCIIRVASFQPSASRQKTNAGPIADSSQAHAQEIKLALMLVLMLWIKQGEKFVPLYAKLIQKTQRKMLKKSKKQKSKTASSIDKSSSQQQTNTSNDNIIVDEIVRMLSTAAFRLRQDQPFRSYLMECIPKSLYLQLPNITDHIFEAFEIQNPYIQSSLAENWQAGNITALPPMKAVKKLKSSKISIKKMALASKKTMMKAGKLTLSSSTGRKPLLGGQRASFRGSHFHRKLNDVSRLLAKPKPVAAIITPGSSRKRPKDKKDSVSTKEGVAIPAKSPVERQSQKGSASSQKPNQNADKTIPVAETPVRRSKRTRSASPDARVVSAYKVKKKCRSTASKPNTTMHTPDRRNKSTCEDASVVPATPLEKKRLDFSSPVQATPVTGTTISCSLHVQGTPTARDIFASPVRRCHEERRHSQIVASPFSKATVCDTPLRYTQAETPTHKGTPEVAQETPLHRAKDWSPWNRSSQKQRSQLFRSEEDGEFRAKLKPRAINLFSTSDMKSRKTRSIFAAPKGSKSAIRPFSNFRPT